MLYIIYIYIYIAVCVFSAVHYVFKSHIACSYCFCEVEFPLRYISYSHVNLKVDPKFLRNLKYAKKGNMKAIRKRNEEKARKALEAFAQKAEKMEQ